jgi:Domain of unknown function (DUF1707)
MAEPGDHGAAAVGGHGHQRASHADREHAIEVLKDAFVQDRLTKDELDTRVGQAFASRTYAELAAVTADIPAGPAAAPPQRQPGRTQNRAGGSHTVRDVAIGLGAGPIVAAVIIFGGLLQYAFLLPLAVPIIAVVLFAVNAAATSLQQRRSGGQLPPRPGQGGQAPEVQRPGQVGHDPALPRDRPDQACTDLRSDGSPLDRPHPSGLAARAPRGIRPVPGVV